MPANGKSNSSPIDSRIKSSKGTSDRYSRGTTIVLTNRDLSARGIEAVEDDSMNEDITAPFCAIPEHYFERQLASIESHGSPRLIIERW